MSGKPEKNRSVTQRVANQAQSLRLSRVEAFTAYAMDRLLYRLGRSRHAKEFYLKGGVLVANILDAPHRFTRDIDFLRRRGPADPGDMRRKFRDIVAVKIEDGVHFELDGVRAEIARREFEDYEGVRVSIRAAVGETEVELKVDVGFGDAVVPPAQRTSLRPFLPGDPAAQVWSYQTECVLAEKIETLIGKFPAISHRLKDILDVVTLSETTSFACDDLIESLRATFTRRGTEADVRVLDDMRAELKGKRWETDWATMRKEKAVAVEMTLCDAAARFEQFVRPLLEAIRK